MGREAGVGDPGRSESRQRRRAEGPLPLNLLFVSSLGLPSRTVYQKRWGSEMNILFVSKLSQFARSVFPISKYVELGKQLGHRVALYGEQTNEPPTLPHSLDTKAFDVAIFLVSNSSDFPTTPYLPHPPPRIPHHP